MPTPNVILAAMAAGCARLASEHSGAVPAGGVEVTAGMPDNPDAERFELFHINI